jgi:energy-coupling factor transporter ATP-binding protein EcfA2
MPDGPPTSWKRQGLKTIGALAVPALAALAARYHLDTATWKETVSRLPVWGLALILAGAPTAWILIAFLGAFFKELGALASSGGRSAAQAVAHAPEALKNVLGRGWDRVAACLYRRSFDGRYRRRLYEDYGLFNDRGLGLINAARLDLDKVYVELQIGSAQVVPTRMELLRQPMEGRHTVWDFLRAVRPGRGLAFIGPPGSGKTTLLQHLLLVFARNRQGRHGLRRLLPILVELRNLMESLKKGTPPTLADAIRSYWKTESRINDLMKLEPTGWLEKRLRSSRVLLLLDGLDEVPQAQRVQVSAWVQEQMRHEDHRRCLFLLTSRPGGYVDAPLSGATVLEVQSFSPAQTSKFIDCWYLANEIAASGNQDSEPVRRRATKDATDLRDRLRENPGLYDLTVNPLLLTMVCMVHRYRGALPGSRSQLYWDRRSCCACCPGSWAF